VPHVHNPNFTGRHEALLSLWDDFDSADPNRTIQAIHGRGGIGKTRLAAEYALSYASNYDVVWWVRADTPATLTADLASLASALGLPEGSQPDQARALAAARLWLGRHGRWLLIFDNAADTTSLQPFLPAGSAGHVLVTSQNASWLGLGGSSAIGDLAIEPAVQFLLKRTGQSDRVAAEALAVDLGGLPLALEQAAAYVETTGCSLAWYRDLFKERERELMAAGPQPADYPYTVATTWDLALREVHTSSEPAALLLQVAAFFASTRMETSDLQAGAAEMEDKLATAIGDDITFHSMVATLRRYSLWEIEGEGFAIHPLVQAVSRARMDLDSEIATALYAAELLSWVFPGDPGTPANWPACERLLPHALATTRHVLRLDAASRYVAALLTNVGGYFTARGQHAEAKSVLQQALDMSWAHVAPDDPEIAFRLNNLGGALDALGDSLGAQACFERAVEILKPAGLEYLDDLAKSLSNLGAALSHQGDHDGALVHYHEARRIHEELHGKEHPTTAVDVNNIGVAHRDKAEWGVALPFLDEAVKTLRLTVGDHDPRYVTGVASVGMVLFKLGRNSEARVHFEDAVRIGIAIYGEDHPDVVWFLMLLSGFLEAMGEVERARVTADQGLRIARGVHGENHARTRELAKRASRLRLAYRDPRMQRRLSRKIADS
jgi:tetratricopeptide (TPR) repeat protein